MKFISIRDISQETLKKPWESRAPWSVPDSCVDDYCKLCIYLYVFGQSWMLVIGFYCFHSFDSMLYCEYQELFLRFSIPGNFLERYQTWIILINTTGWTRSEIYINFWLLKSGFSETLLVNHTQQLWYRIHLKNDISEQIDACWDCFPMSTIFDTSTRILHTPKTLFMVQISHAARSDHKEDLCLRNCPLQQSTLLSLGVDPVLKNLATCLLWLALS